MAGSFYWHDYETWGADPARDRPVQFAGQRTDLDLNPIGKPLIVYARPTDDMLPHPDACVITGITPQFAAAHGVAEAEFITRIHKELAQPGTCGVGYNSLRFDDEITRYTLFRNFFDPYGREWRNGNSRWDLIDVMRMAHALRPEGLEWSQPHDDGKTSFRLPDLSAANDIAHEAAHEALSDVQATIGLARLLRERQPRLFEFALSLRDKQEVKKHLGLPTPKPIVHVSSKYPAEQGCIAPILALAPHPTDRNGVIAIDLRADPGLLLDLDVPEIKRRLFTRSEDLPNGIERVPLKVVHINRVPMLAPIEVLTSKIAERWSIDLGLINLHATRLQAALETLPTKLAQIFTTPEAAPKDPEQDLYGGLLSNSDLAQGAIVRATPPEKLRDLKIKFRDYRLNTIFFRYRARNWPETLTPSEQRQWDSYRMQRLNNAEVGGSLTVATYHELITTFREKHANTPAALNILNSLDEWVAAKIS